MTVIISYPKRKYHPRKAPKRSLQRSKPRKRTNPRKALEALQKQIVRLLYGTDCYTCPAKNLQGSNCQLGHVPWPRSQLSTICKFDYTYTRMQCFKCNIWDKGRGADALLRMQREHIDVDVMETRNLETKGKVCNTKWFEEKIVEYQQLLSELLREKEV